MLEIKDLYKGYDKNPVIKNISITVDRGEIHGLIGENSAGKTTLMQMVCGIVAPTSGEVLVNGKNNLRLGEKFRDVLGYLPQEFGYTPGFSAKDFMLYIASIKGLDPHFAKRKTNDLLALVNLEDAANHKIRTFSGGMKRRLGIAQALLNDPEILILDEPTAGLDPKERAYFRNIISEMANGKIIIISTHIVSDIEYISDQILIMKKGRLILQGSAESLLPEVDGMVWNVTIPQNEWIHFEAHHSIVNSHNQGTVVEARVISNKRPTEEAVAVVPTLEDLYLKCFADEIEETR